MDKERLQHLAGLTEQYAPEKALRSLIIVHDPMSDESTLGDVMYEAPAENIIFWAKGLELDPREMNIVFYTPSNRQAAVRDAQRRLGKTGDK